MAELADIHNDSIRNEIEEFIEDEVERQRIIDLFAPIRPEMQEIAAGVIEGTHLIVDELTQTALKDGITALTIMNEGLTSGMAIVGIKFRENFIFVPEVLGCARAMKKGMVHIEPILAASGIEPIGTVVIGTVQGDLHDIGKNLCIMMLRGAGFKVVDLGVDVSPQDFMDAIKERPDAIVGMSALLTTTMPNMGKTIEAFTEAKLRDEMKFMVGGAPITPQFANDIGADGYGANAVECVEVAQGFVQALKSSTSS
jgi:5-methyltetrahydrofolate--homocysteine methyltransferase